MSESPEQQPLIRPATANLAPYQALLVVIGLLGALPYAAVFAITYSTPVWVEEVGRDFIERKARERLDESVARVQIVVTPDGDSQLGQLARSLYEKNEDRIAKLQAALEARVAEQFAAAIAQIRDIDCECRAKWAELIRDGIQTELELAQAANDKIVDFVQGSYMEITDELRRDIRIFSGTNVVVFLLLVLVAIGKRRAARHLMLPAVLLVCSTLICSYFYIFEQNWLLTIIYGDYTGLAYLAYLGLVFAILLDVVLNRARVTTEIVNFFLNLIGSATAVIPC
ncbi:MAG: hypothetical protein AAGM16_13320 [Pseudomonadota bacterium]